MIKRSTHHTHHEVHVLDLAEHPTRENERLGKCKRLGFLVNNCAPTHLFRSQKRRSDKVHEEEELLDFAFLESSVPTVAEVAATETEDEPQIGEEEQFLIRDFLSQTQEVGVYPRLNSFGTIPVNELTEEESLLHFREQLLRLSELYRSQFRRLYDSLQTSYN